ncbi:MAG: NAD(P)-dependent alcohol dehydrogenase [Balneola sp.]|jgi:NADPH:quinone reductase-like Zn-dependent oxidoreductase|nr:NAD(P)-dependent alcohol dehydrogenase [Balneola sp.]MBE78856.1 NAD(P)-dependent alcohol dehydrogenase [Balneola sp.]|tara:strand:- start:341 stop:1309 length:969 start_codon:yes stop_codon:yes gene_type:complete
MKAIVNDKYGGPEVLVMKEIPKPALAQNQVLVKVHASTVNRTDCAILRAKPFIMRFIHGMKKPKIQIPGTDFSGEIVSVGSSVSMYKAGDKVFGFNDTGLASKAEFMVLDEDDKFGKMPQGVSYEQAAATLEGVHYAYNFINKVDLKKGDKVLVNGASGAIGSALVQLLKYWEAEVTAVANTKNLGLMKSIGASTVIDYQQEDFTKTNGTFHYVFDAVGKSTFSKCKPLLKDSGVYISSELGPYIQNPFLALITSFSAGKKVKFPVPFDVKESIRIAAKLIEEGRYEAVIGRSYSLDQIQEAYQYVETGEKTGNVVIKIVEG